MPIIHLRNREDKSRYPIDIETGELVLILRNSRSKRRVLGRLDSVTQSPLKDWERLRLNPSFQLRPYHQFAGTSIPFVLASNSGGNNYTIHYNTCHITEFVIGQEKIAEYLRTHDTEWLRLYANWVESFKRPYELNV
tara:strand:+ start:1095 stop:1505 length:411 start_codon:yes stop_codon:yes gene_type:complete